jgi:hypothetical protein
MRRFDDNAPTFVIPKKPRLEATSSSGSFRHHGPCESKKRESIFSLLLDRLHLHLGSNIQDSALPQSQHPKFQFLIQFGVERGSLKPIFMHTPTPFPIFPINKLHIYYLRKQLLGRMNRGGESLYHMDSRSSRESGL